MKFEKEFVHYMYDEELVGKICVFADGLPDLRKNVENCDFDFIGALQAPQLKPDKSVDDLVYPFYRDVEECYRFIYCDPNFEVKIAYYRDGKQVQYRTSDNDTWEDCGEPTWATSGEYRVKPEPEPEPDDRYVPYDTVTEMMCDHFNVDCTEDIKNCIWVRPKADTSIRFMVTGIDINQVMVDSIWLNPSQLLDDYLWDDYMVIGK